MMILKLLHRFYNARMHPLHRIIPHKRRGGRQNIRCMLFQLHRTGIQYIAWKTCAKNSRGLRELVNGTRTPSVATRNTKGRLCVKTQSSPKAPQPVLAHTVPYGFRGREKKKKKMSSVTCDSPFRTPCKFRLKGFQGLLRSFPISKAVAALAFFSQTVAILAAKKEYFLPTYSVLRKTSTQLKAKIPHRTVRLMYFLSPILPRKKTGNVLEQCILQSLSKDWQYEKPLTSIKQGA